MKVRIEFPTKFGKDTASGVTTYAAVDNAVIEVEAGSLFELKEVANAALKVLWGDNAREFDYASYDA